MLKKIILITFSLIIFIIICLVITSNQIKKTYSKFKDEVSFEKNLNFDLEGLLKLDSMAIESEILNNKTTLIQFTFNGCSPCKKAQFFFPRLLDQTNEKFQIITISIDKFNYWKNLNKYNFEKRWIKLNIGNSNLREHLKVKGFPTYFIINEDGKIMARPYFSDGIQAIRNYFKIKPNRIDLLIEHISELNETNRFWNYILMYTFIYIFLLGTLLLLRFLIRKLMSRKKIR